MNDRPYWFGSPLKRLPRLEETIVADAVVVGGGVAGLTVAQLLADRGQNVVVVERDVCGSGATGRSSGFITPDSELQTTQLLRRFGADDAGLLWRAAAAECSFIRSVVTEERIDCDYLPADCLFIGAGSSGRSAVESEDDSRRALGLPSRLYDSKELSSAIGGAGFDAAVRYGDTFAITPHRYALGLRDLLIRRGVRIFEDTDVISASATEIRSAHGVVRAKTVFLCADAGLAQIGARRGAAYHAQTFLAASEPLPASRWDELFPDGDLLVWDTETIYQYFRRTSDDRLLLGGGLLRKTYAPPATPTVILETLYDYIAAHLPPMQGVAFTHVWSGLIGVTKDLLPLAGRDARTGVFFAGCAAGVPWSVVSARCAVDLATRGASPLERFLDPSRAFTDLDPLQPILGKPATFALSHAYTKGMLRGSADAVRRRRPFLFGAGLALGALILSRAAKRRR